MKKFLLATLCILIGVLAFAQAPQKISYQAVIRNNSGNLVTNQQVSLRISIMKNGGTTGQIDQPIVNRSIVAIYTETHTVTTNANGLATIEIGGGTTSDNFAAIDWSNGTYYLKTSVDLTGRGRYEVMGMSQLISVPYAMYAQKAGSAATETDPQFNAWDKDYNDLTNRPEIPVVPTNVSAFENDAQYITSADVPAQVNADWNATSGVEQIMNKPEIPTVPTNVSAFANDANYITSADVPAQVNADWNATSGAGQILNKPEIPTVPTNVSAFANDANYITSADVPAQVNADWNATSGAGQILNKPEIPTVPTNVSAFNNDANYITSADVPAQVNADWNATSGAGQILNKPELFSGNYNDLTNKPTIPAVPTNVSAFANDANYITSADVPAQVNADWNATSGAGQILNKPEIPTVPTNVSAFTNDANYITSADVPAQVNADWNATSGAGQILNKPELFSGNYNDLTNRPEIPTVPTNVSAFTNDANYITSADVPAQVNADWNATSGAGQILNKPEIPTVPTNVSAFDNDRGYITSASIPTNISAFTNDRGYVTAASIPTNVSAFTNDRGYITSADVPAQVNADWNATSGAGQILNKPAIPTVPTNVSAFTNDANYITSADVPAQVNADWNATSGAGQILNKPELFSGNYNDLTNKPTIPTVPTNVSAFTNDANYITSADVPAQVNADWNATSGAGQILNKPEIPTVPTNVSAFTNDANYITSADVPAQVNADWNATSGAGQILNKPEIPTVPTNVSAFANDANYITNADVPAQVNADWNATNGAGQILNKPEIPTVPTNVSAFTNDANYITSADVPAQVNADWNATSGAGQILNKPEFFDGNYNNLTNTPDLSSYITDETQTLTDVVALSNSAGNRQIKNVADPTENQDAVTKKYLEDIIAELRAEIAALQSTVESLSSGQNVNSGTLNGHDWVDLGLPSGTRWATCNVGSTTPEGYGNYYAWGETTTKATYNSSTYTYSDNPTTLPSNRDAATVNWGSGWRMPTKEECEELKNNCTYTWVTMDDVNGWRFTGPNGNSIFLPAAGFRHVSLDYDGYDGYYWSSSRNLDYTDGAWCLYFQSDDYGMNNSNRRYGLSVRPVCVSQNPNTTSYNVTFDANGGLGTMQPQTFADGIAQAITTNTFTKENYTFAGWNTAANGSGTAYADGQSITVTGNMTLYAQWEIATSGTLGGHYWVDLGLPSGTLWANCNVGANNPEDFGNYYMWGETSPYTGGSSTYNSNPTVLPSSADAAAVNWGEEWRMPTKAEMQELISNCTIVSSTQGNVSGRLFTGPNGNSIFIPGAGYKYGTFSQGGTNVYYMSSSSGTSSSTVWILLIDSNGAKINSSTRAGYPVRPVCPATAITGSTNQSQQTPFGSFTDTRDGNEYATVKIGEQTWMAENLRYVGNVSMGSMASSAVAYRYYPSNNASNVSTYGYLYNWTAAMNGSSSSSANPSGVQGICPNGWHLPSSDEWTQLRDALDNTDVGSKLAGSAELWASGALNENSSFGTSGFNALPSGTYQSNQYYYFGEATNFWSATENDSDNALGRSLRYNSTASSVLMGGKQQGYSIRCVRND